MKSNKFQIIFSLPAAFHCLGTEGRLNKRNGYIYKTPSSSSSHRDSGSGALFEPHEELSAPSAPDLQVYTSGKSGGGGRHSSKYDDGYYDYKLAPSSSSEEAAPDHSYTTANDHLVSSASASKHGYSIGSGLRSIAQGSANQAFSAVASQHAAAKQAAFLAKNSLAQAASQAAATAQAALQGKEVLLQELQHQAAEAQRALSRELEQLKVAKIAAKLAEQTAQAAHNHVSVLTAAINNAKAVAEHADQASQEVSNQLASQSAMVGQAKSRLEQVEEQLKQASIDFEATKEATLKAASSAAEAQVNASKAAAHATIELHESTQHHNEPSEDVSYEDAQPFSHGGHAASGSSIDRRKHH